LGGRTRKRWNFLKSNTGKGHLPPPTSKIGIGGTDKKSTLKQEAREKRDGKSGGGN